MLSDPYKDWEAKQVQTSDARAAQVILRSAESAECSIIDFRSEHSHTSIRVFVES